MELRGDLPGGRRELRIGVGPFAVAVTEVPGRSLAEREWRDILLARRSYAAMWGGACTDVIADDPLDGRDCAFYEAKHYLAWVRDETGAKLVTMRKARVVPSELSAEQRADPSGLLPFDIRFWRAGEVPLWEPLRAYARSLAPHEPLAEFRIAAMGRMAAWPHGEPKRTSRERERTAVAFAAIQLLAAHADSNLLWVWTLCPELRDRVTGVHDLDGVYVAPDFKRTETVLGLPPGSVRLDNGLPEVQEHRVAFPGYFLDNEDAAQVLAGLLDEGRLTVGDLVFAVVRLVHAEAALGTDDRQLEELVGLVALPDHQRLAAALTSPRHFKHLIPLLAGAQPLSRMANREFRDRILAETRDGPFSATVIPTEWAASIRAILEAAQEKYGEGKRPIRPPDAAVAESPIGASA